MSSSDVFLFCKKDNENYSVQYKYAMHSKIETQSAPDGEKYQTVRQK